MDATEDFDGTAVTRRSKRPYLAHRGFRLVDASSGTLIFEGMRPRILVGTGESCDVRLEDTSVSRHHCELTAHDRGCTVRDLESTNGTRVDGVEVFSAPLPPGGILELGESRLRFEPVTDLLPLEASSEAFGPLVGRSAPMRRLFGLFERLAPTELTCVLLGDTGTGKELAARALHGASPRGAGPFVVVDCGAVTANLVESELFGHNRGAFTGAHTARPGAFELAHQGTIFLDEIGELPLSLQPKLLRALERREVKRLGASRPVAVDVRVVAATHRELADMIEDGSFREDLYFRLAEAVVRLPPLCERRDDIPLIASTMLHELDPDASIADDAMERLEGQPYPGNVRELRNLLRRALALSDSTRITSRALVEARQLTARPLEQTAAVESGAPANAAYDHLPLRDARAHWTADFEARYVRAVLARFDGDTWAAAQHADIHRKSLLRLMRAHGIPLEEND